MQNNHSNSYFFGFSRWKYWLVDIEPFFDEKPRFVNLWFGREYLKKALKLGINQHSKIYIWGGRSFPDIEKYALENSILIYRVEDGFIRSVGLGSDLTQPYSLVVDTRGIYFDPTNTSDLEYILETNVFDSAILERARNVKHYLIEKKLSKYNLYSDYSIDLPSDKSIIVVPGQVEDDASILLGADGMSNLELLKQVRQNRPDGYIVYKPHPDVLVGNRVGNIDEGIALKYCDKIVTKMSIDSVLSHAHEVHTMTSLVGFEALMRGIPVFTYGFPFYAGWGLSEDRIECNRRTKRLCIDELIAGTLILYPRYMHPGTKKCCEIEELLQVMDSERGTYNNSIWTKIRNTISRKSQQILRKIQK